MASHSGLWEQDSAGKEEDHADGGSNEEADGGTFSGPSCPTLRNSEERQKKSHTYDEPER